MRKVINIQLIIILCLLLFGTGCTQQQQTSTSLNSKNKVQEEKIHIQIAYYGKEKQQEAFKSIFDGYMKKYPNVVIEPIASGWTEHFERINGEIIAGEGPAVYLLDGPFVSAYEARGILEELKVLENEMDLSQYYGIDRLRNSDGKLYAVPQGIQVDVLYYNKNMFDDAGVPYPTPQWTYEDLIDAAKKLTNDNQWGIAFPNHVRYTWYPVVRQFGGDLLDDTRQNSTIASDPKVREALKFIYDTWHTYKVSPTFEDTLGKLGTNAKTYFPQQKVAMIYSNYSSISICNKEDIDYDVQTQPKQNSEENYASFIANTWVLNKNSSDAQKKAGLNFIKYYLSEEVQKVHAQGGDSLPANKKICKEVVLNLPNGPENKQAFLDTLEFADSLGENVVWEQWTSTFNNIFAEYLSKEITLDQCIEQADKAVQEVLDEYYKR